MLDKHAGIAFLLDAIPVRAARSYYQGGRAVARAIRETDLQAIRRAAVELTPHVAGGDVLVPIPGHGGFARQTLALAEMLGGVTGAPVADVLTGKLRQSLCAVKKAGGDPAAVELGLRLASERLPGGRILLLDSVIATGTTARAAIRCVAAAGRPLAVLAYACAMG